MRRPVFLDRWDRLTKDEIRRWQGEALGRYLNEEVLAYSPFYRKYYEEQKADVRKVRSLDDLCRLPFTAKSQFVPTKEDPKRFAQLILAPDKELIRKHAPLDRLATLMLKGAFQGQEEVQKDLGREYRPVFLTFTTGRSASPTAFLYSLFDLSILKGVGGRIADVMGLNPARDRGVNLFPFAPHLAFWQTFYAGVGAGVLILHTGGGKVMGTAGCLAAVSRIRPTFLMGVPGYVYHLLREGGANGADFSDVRLVILGGDRSPPELRKRMKEALESRGAKDPRILSVYGFTEARTCWPECPAGAVNGFHLYPDLGIVELIDPETGDPVEEGKQGELVFTSLGWRGSALVRYRTGDLISGGMTWEPCPGCGRSSPRLVGDIRRVSDVSEFNFSKVRGTLVDFNQIAEYLGSEPRIEEWQVVVAKESGDPYGLDEMVLSVALRDGPESPDDWSAGMKKRFLAHCEVAPNRVEVVPLAQMSKRLGMEDRLKEQRIVDLRPKG